MPWPFSRLIFFKKKMAGVGVAVALESAVYCCWTSYSIHFSILVKNGLGHFRMSDATRQDRTSRRLLVARIGSGAPEREQAEEAS